MKNNLAKAGKFVADHRGAILTSALIATAVVAAAKHAQVNTLTDFLAEKELLTEFENYLSIEA